MIIRSMVASVVCLCLSGCSSTQIKHLNSDDFMKQAEQIGQVHSAHSTSYVGSTGRRAYLEYWSAVTVWGDSRTTIYWTESSALSEAQMKMLKRR